MRYPANKTKIICTIGPASETPEMLDSLLRAGMNIARLNFSHGDFSSHKKTIKKLREASERTGHRLAIMADLPGPKMRIGELEKEPVYLKPGKEFILTTDDIIGNKNRVSITLKELPLMVKTGDNLFINDGLIALMVKSIENNNVICEVKTGGELSSRKGLNLPGIELGFSAFTEQDKKCLEFALKHGVDAVSQSFVASKEDIIDLKKASDSMGYKPFVIAKIERSGALNNLEDILNVSDGIMVARGDLGVEIPISAIAITQKKIVRLSRQFGKPVITATQMLESMINNRRPTRAETTDVANAILDGTDAVMLSGESAMGKYPVDATAMLAEIATYTEQHKQDDVEMMRFKDDMTLPNIVSHNLEMTARHMNSQAVVIPTQSGNMARNVSKYRLPGWITAFSNQPETCQNLQFSYGVFPIQTKKVYNDWTSYIRKWFKKQEIKEGIVILAQGPSEENPLGNHRLELIDLCLK